MEQETFTIEQLRLAFKFQKFLEATFPDVQPKLVLWPEPEKYLEVESDYEQHR